MFISPIRLSIGSLLIVASLLTGGPGAAGNLIPAVAAGPLLVHDDRGGRIVARAREIDALRQSGRDVRIVGGVCYSACTMLLGLPKACVSRNTVFGFHGPSESGRRLDPDRFERASRLIAGYYPAQLRDWYLATARYRISGLFRLAGSDLIAMGVRAC